MRKQGMRICFTALFILIAGGASVWAQPFRFLDAPEMSGDTLKIMSYNIHHGANKDEQLTLDEIGAFIKASGADLVGLQEVDSMCRRSGQQDQMKRLAEITGMHYVFERHFAYDGGAYGLGLLSRYPLLEARGDRITSTSSDGTLKTLVLVSAKVDLPSGNAMRMSSVHLALDQPTRMTQGKETLQYLEDDIPIILTGDMNAKPDNAVIGLLKTRFSTTDVNLLPTFPAQDPNRKIDFIMVSKNALKRVLKAEVPNVTYSDHLPLMSTVELKY